MAEQTNFHCTICLDDKFEIPTRVPPAADSDLVCAECFIAYVTPAFVRALQYEFWYPVRWGPGVVLNPQAYPRYFDHHFLLLWYRRMRECATPPRRRIYCSHNILDITPRPRLPYGQTLALRDEDRLNTPLSTVRCGTYIGQQSPLGYYIFCRGTFACGGLTCGYCGAPVFYHVHPCIAPPAMTAIDLEESSRPQRRGQDYQICPNEACLRPVALWDGCNQIRCLCGQSLCFLCGEAVPEANGHFLRGGTCPRFGRPEDEGAVWDVEQEDSEDEDSRMGEGDWQDDDDRHDSGREDEEMGTGEGDQRNGDDADVGGFDAWVTLDPGSPPRWRRRTSV